MVEIEEYLKNFELEKLVEKFKEKGIIIQDLHDLVYTVLKKFGEEEQEKQSQILKAVHEIANVTSQAVNTTTILTSTPKDEDQKKEKKEDKKEDKEEEESNEEEKEGSKRKRTKPEKKKSSGYGVLIKDALKIHEAIHDPEATKVTLSTGEVIPVSKSKNGCRSAKVLNVSWMEQNKKKPSTYARRANQGHKLTWVLYERRWGLICDDRIEINCPLFNHSDEEEEEEEVSSEEEGGEKITSAPSQKKRKVDSSDQGSHQQVQTLSTHKIQISVEFPEYWEGPFTEVRQIEISGKEFKDLETMFLKTLTRKVKVNKISRIQHPLLWQQYFIRKSVVSEINKSKPEKIPRVTTKLLDENANEYYLFHGCSESVVEKIIQGGFDERLGSLKGLFGSGIYLAENAEKSCAYTHTKDCAQVKFSNLFI